MVRVLSPPLLVVGAAAIDAQSYSAYSSAMAFCWCCVFVVGWNDQVVSAGGWWWRRRLVVAVLVA